MPITAYPYIDEILDHLLAEMQKVLGEKLLGLYLYGSLVSGDFDHDTSDLDMLAVIASDLDDKEAVDLKQMHEDFVRQNPKWEDRIEVQYFSVAGLKTFRTQSSKMGNISPGEPFHIIDSGIEWLLNWYFVRENDVILFGPSSHQFIAPISKEEYMQVVHDHTRQWAEYVQNTKTSWPGQSYAILTLCRALYSHTNGEQVSKKKAAEWAAQQLPEWASLIQKALLWRKHWKPEHSSPEATYPETERFVYFVIGQILGP
jgi:predicted nucleotidyltransferase